eukprot:CAMPEP_0168187756 /NCGR_PEP_ID=MMETSP0139_2-20121125/15221_1 /TAXON_ID=44445 /ORGANISM="Pseudo-nitzschia australis, Strain 10249 10 AB" /LENGTH=192 /DNA_ID=CAMNT_0008110023 /DNA_START=128 /DNA_END=703 /DNA_ORIENTATION=-
MGRNKDSDNCDDAASSPSLSFVHRMRHATVLCCFKLKYQGKISLLEFQIMRLKKKFGVEYLTLVGDNASVEDLKECLKTALDEVAELEAEIDHFFNKIDGKEQKLTDKTTRTKITDELLDSNENNTKQSKSKPKSKGKKSTKPRGDSFDWGSSNDDDFDDDNNYDNAEGVSHTKRGSVSEKKRRMPKKKGAW